MTSSIKRANMIWGTILIVAGLIFLLNTLNVLPYSIWGTLWPLALIGFGVFVLWDYLQNPESAEPEAAEIPLQDALSGRIKISHAAGRLQIDDGAPSGFLLAGQFNGGVDAHTRYHEKSVAVEMRPPERGFVTLFSPGHWRSGLSWAVNLNGEIPLSLKIETGAGENRLDFSDLQVKELALETGASQTQLTLPARAGFTEVEIECGVAQVNVHLPDGVAARIRSESGLSAVNIDSSRFPATGNLHQSPNYETAENRADIRIKAGVGSVSVR